MKLRNVIPIVIILVGFFIISIFCWGMWKSTPFIRDLVMGLFQTQRETKNVEAPVQRFFKVTTAGGHSPNFGSQNEAIYYINNSGQLVYLSPLDGSAAAQELIELPPKANLVWDASGNFAIVEWEVSPEGIYALDILDRNKMSLEVLSENAWGGAWNPSGSHISFIQRQDDAIGLWQIKPDGRGAIQLADISDIVAPEYVAWSALGNRFLIQAAVGVAVFAYIDKAAAQISWIPWAQDAGWSPDGWKIAYRERGQENDILWLANLDGEEQAQLWEGAFSQMKWHPDGRLVYFSPGIDGGAACWIVDTATGLREILVDSSITVWKPVDDFSLSPTGEKIAFLAQDRQIWVLILTK